MAHSRRDLIRACRCHRWIADFDPVSCGTHLSAINAGHPEIMPIRVGALDEPGVFGPGANLWVRSTQPWHRIDRALACFETQPAT